MTQTSVSKEQKLNYKLARIILPPDTLGSPRAYIDDVPPTLDGLALAKWVLAISDTAAYAVINGDTMQTDYIVFEGNIFDRR